MSFILDALKKSEAERARKSGPTLIDMRIASPRRRVPVWVAALVLILLVNLAVLAFVLLRGESRATAPTAVAAANTPVVPVVALPAPEAAPPAPVNALPPPVLESAVPAPPPAATADLPQGQAIQPDAPPAPSPRPVARAPVDTSGLPSIEDLRTAGVGLPELRLSLHVYDAVPANRYVLLNSQKMREGDATSDGVMLEHITERGAVLSWRAQRFTLSPGD